MQAVAARRIQEPQNRPSPRPAAILTRDGTRSVSPRLIFNKQRAAAAPGSGPALNGRACRTVLPTRERADGPGSFRAAISAHILCARRNTAVGPIPGLAVSCLDAFKRQACSLYVHQEYCQPHRVGHANSSTFGSRSPGLKETDRPQLEILGADSWSRFLPILGADSWSRFRHRLRLLGGIGPRRTTTSRSGFFLSRHRDSRASRAAQGGVGGRGRLDIGLRADQTIQRTALPCFSTTQSTTR